MSRGDVRDASVRRVSQLPGESPPNCETCPKRNAYVVTLDGT
jgi:hypothetical protein